MTPKEATAQTAADLVPSDAVIGLGTGSTADLFLHALAVRMEKGEVREILGVPTSRRTEALARRLAIPVAEPGDHSSIDITFDGADEVDPAWNLTKGGGGSLLREKIIAQASAQLVIMVDESKIVPRLGSSFSLPIDVAPFGWRLHLPFLRELGAEPRLRVDEAGETFHTDEGNIVLDLDFRPSGGIRDLASLEAELRGRVGVVETGLFLGRTTRLVVGSGSGAVIHDRPGKPDPNRAAR